MSQDANLASAEAAPDRFTLLRALGHREPDAALRCPDHLAEWYLDTSWRQALQFSPMLRQRWEATAPGAYGYALARTRFFDEILRDCIQAGVHQIVILGAGFDSRADRFAAREPLQVFELDRATVLHRKAQRRQAAELPPCPNEVHAVPVDLAHADLPALLRALDLDRHAPVLILAEGLLYYLDGSRLDTLLSFLATDAVPGSSLAFDYAHTSLLAAPDTLHGGAHVARFAQDSGQPLRFSTTPEALADQCAAAGLTVLRDLDQEAMAKQWLAAARATPTGTPMGGFHFAHVARPATTSVCNSNNEEP